MRRIPRIIRPGGPTTLVNPTGNGGYIANTQGVGTSFANRMGNGRYIVSDTPVGKRQCVSR